MTEKKKKKKRTVFNECGRPLDRVKMTTDIYRFSLRNGRTFQRKKKNGQF